jgi:NAD(P)-dependent dehydrogenase (short-subunit alcohol dehydrogenase family)
MTDYQHFCRLDGKAALITGAARGLGAEMALALGSAGASLLLTDVLDDVLADTAEQVRKTGARVVTLHHDDRDEAQWEAAVAAAIDAFGGLDIVVNNAGIERMSLIANCELEEFKLVQDVNVNGVFLGIKHAVRAMSPGGAAGKGGSIVNLSSVAGLAGVPALIAYCASKGAVRLMTKAAAVECGRLGTGIRVNSIHPAVVQNKMGNDFLRHFVELGVMPDLQASTAAFTAAHPIGHFGSSDDIASAVLYLASDASKWVTGAEFVIDGGFTAT